MRVFYCMSGYLFLIVLGLSNSIYGGQALFRCYAETQFNFCNENRKKYFIKNREDEITIEVSLSSNNDTCINFELERIRGLTTLGEGTDSDRGYSTSSSGVLSLDLIKIIHKKLEESNKQDSWVEINRELFEEHEKPGSSTENFDESRVGFTESGFNILLNALTILALGRNDGHSSLLNNSLKFKSIVIMNEIVILVLSGDEFKTITLKVAHIRNYPQGIKVTISAVEGENDLDDIFETFELIFDAPEVLINFFSVVSENLNQGELFEDECSIDFSSVQLSICECF